jgi:hypothetical protein
MEDLIIRYGDTALQVAEGICGRTETLKTYLYKREQPYKCKERKFPMMLGDGTYNT